MRSTFRTLFAFTLCGFPAWYWPAIAAGTGCETNCAQTSTYTYTGPPLKILNENPIPSGCPADVGNVNAILTGTIAAQCTPTGGPCNVTPTSGTCTVGNYSLPLSSGSYLQISGLGGSVTLAGAVCNVSGAVNLGPSAIGTVYNQASNYGADQFILYVHLPCSKCGGGYQIEQCTYSSNTPGEWIGPFSELFAAKNEGEPSKPVEPEDQPTSPAIVLEGEADGGPDSPPGGDGLPSNPLVPAITVVVPCAHCGNPINAAVGNKVEIATDFVGGPSTGLAFTRTYNSQDTGSTPIGARWRSTWHRTLSFSGATVTATRSDGHQDVFTLNNGVYTSDPDVQSVLTAVLSNGTITAYKLTTAYDATETYAPSGYLLSVTSRAGLKTTLTYDSNNNLTKVTGPFAHVMTFTYAVAPDGNTRIATMTAPDGHVCSYTYDSFGNLTLVTYPDQSIRQYVYENTSYPNFLTGIIDENGNRFATWAYDSSGRAISSQHAGGVDLTTVSYGALSSTVTDARGNAHTYNFSTIFNVVKPVSLSGAPVQSAGGQAFTFDSNGFLASRTDWNGNVTAYANDARGNVLSQTRAAGTAQATTTTQSWLSIFHLPTQIVEPNRTTNFTYDTHGNLLTKTITAGSLTRKFSYIYNTFGQVETATDPNGHVIHYAYDAKGDLASVTNALGQVTRFTSYDGAGRLLTAQDPNGLMATLTYDARARVISRTLGALETSYAYDKVGNVTGVTLPDGSTLALSYDAAHRLTQVTDAVGDLITYTFDATSNVTAMQAYDPSNTQRLTHSFAYDLVDRLSQSVGAAGQTTNFTYDLQSNPISVADPLGHTTSFSYDPLNRLTQTIDPNGGPASFSYDANDNLTAVIDPRNLTTSYAWNGLDERTSLTSPDTGVTAKTFDAAGNVLSSTDARGKTTTYTYDALNRLTKASFADGTSIVAEYDEGTYGIGRLSKITDATGSTSYTYDVYGDVIVKKQVVGTITLTTGFAYDSGGRLSAITYPSGKQVTYAYDAAGRVASITQGAQNLVTGVGYFPFGGASGWTWTQGSQAQATYSRAFDQDGRISGLSLPAGEMVALTYDAASRITGITDSAVAGKTFSYDALDRLTAFTGGTLTQSYGYDADGNRISASLGNEAATDSFTYSYPSTSNRLQSLSGAWSEALTYDADGNTLTYDTPSANYAFTFDAKNRLSQASLGALTTAYGINGLGQRVQKASTSDPSAKTLFAYDEAGRLIGEYGPTGGVVEETVWLNGLPVATLQPTGTYYVAPDHLGAPHQITSASTTVVWLWDHDPFGNGAPTAAAGFTYNLRFPGQYYDSETDLHYNRFRDYDPKIGRYIESDPIGLGGGLNTYAYVGDEPTAQVDPNGLDEKDVIGISGLNFLYKEQDPGLWAYAHKVTNQINSEYFYLAAHGWFDEVSNRYKTDYAALGLSRTKHSYIKDGKMNVIHDVVDYHVIAQEILKSKWDRKQPIKLIVCGAGNGLAQMIADDLYRATGRRVEVLASKATLAPGTNAWGQDFLQNVDHPVSAFGRFWWFPAQFEWFLGNQK